MSDQYAISEGELSSIIDDLNSENVEVSKCLEGISSIFDSITNTLEGEMSETIKAKMIAIEDMFPTIKSNHESYVSDLQTVIKRYNEEESTISVGEVNLAKGGETVNVKK